MNKEILNIALIQFDIVWKNPNSNRTAIAKFITPLDSCDLIVLPEMFTTGFISDPIGMSEKMDGKTVMWMKEMAISKQSAICGSIVIQENKNYYNRFLFVKPNGEIDYYNKRHLFSYGGENKFYTAGESRKNISYKGWNIALFICYDLRFPVWSRNITNYDLAIFVANWPSVRIEAWNTLLKARAIENQSYVIGVNRVGVDGNALSYSGNSQFLNPLGDVEKADVTDNVIQLALDKAELLKIRNVFPFLKDQDQFNFDE